jgi:hypothetical protein
MDQTSKKLSKLYYDISRPEGFSSAQKLSAASGVKLNDVKKWLSSQDAYTQHKPVRRKFTRNRYLVSKIKQFYEADLADMKNIKSENNGFKYILCVIDIFSKKAWGVALRDKKCATVAKALKTIFSRAGSPKYFRSDRGREFIGPEVRKILKNNSITQILTNNEDIKCAVVERFLRTIKERIYRYFTHYGKKKYIHILQDVFNSYNNSRHSAIGLAPNAVNENNVEEVYNYLYSGKGRYQKLDFKENARESALKVDDCVKLATAKHKLDKGYHPNWSYEVFKIAKIIKRNPVVYKLLDWQGEEVSGVWYEPELQKVTVLDDQIFRIEKILGAKGVGKNRKLLVKWLGYPDKFNSYIAEKDLLSYE